MHQPNTLPRLQDEAFTEVGRLRCSSRSSRAMLNIPCHIQPHDFTSRGMAALTSGQNQLMLARPFATVSAPDTIYATAPAPVTPSSDPHGANEFANSHLYSISSAAYTDRHTKNNDSHIVHRVSRSTSLYPSQPVPSRTFTWGGHRCCQVPQANALTSTPRMRSFECRARLHALVGRACSPSVHHQRKYVDAPDASYAPPAMHRGEMLPPPQWSPGNMPYGSTPSSSAPRACWASNDGARYAPPAPGPSATFNPAKVSRRILHVSALL
ncbi:hypothetical protein EVG20_g10912 [Dentipellis fragilis]|uniref:Uncharacterized protein n=1 Tax=Dentipellis fragilis TaxID=205917 RepID=A0A4Y9XQI9_9AGAM|nr:hypothetical protein EVG20_g10912 [Dentipellis fragilis]